MTELAGRSAEAAAEKGTEGTEAFEPGFEANFRDAQVRLFQHVCGAFEPVSREIGMRRFTKELGKRTMEMERRKTSGARRLL